MDLPPLLVQIKLNDWQQSYFVSGDEYPAYLWAVFFTIDGDTVVLNGNGQLQGYAFVDAMPGDHGDIGSDGTLLRGIIPSSTGEFWTRLKAIPVDPALRGFIGPSVPGIVGCLAVLLVQQDTPDDAVAKGHAALNNSLQQQLNGVIPTLGFKKQKITPADIQAIQDRVQDAVISAIKEALTLWDKIKFVLGFEPQDFAIENDPNKGPSFIFSHDDLLTAGLKDFQARGAIRGQRQRGGPSNQELVVWVINGQVTATTPFWVAGSGTIAPDSSQDWSFSWGGADMGPQLIQAEPINSSGMLVTTQIGESRDDAGQLTYWARVHNQGASPVQFQWRGGKP